MLALIIPVYLFLYYTDHCWQVKFSEGFWLSAKKYYRESNEIKDFITFTCYFELKVFFLSTAYKEECFCLAKTPYLPTSSGSNATIPLT